MAQRFSARSRAYRGEQFRRLLGPTAEDRILDLGGGDGRHFAAISPLRDNVTVADIAESDLATASREFGFQTVKLEELGRLPFDDRAFDIVFCSSVIEHVTGPKAAVEQMRDTREFEASSRLHQEQFAAELRRITSSYFVQTPNRYYPIESHSWLPGVVAVLPRSAHVTTIDITNRFWINTTSPDWRLLTASEMAELFPDAEIERERSLGFTKSLLAIKGRQPRS